MTQIEDAKKGILTEEMKHVAKIENKSEDFILRSVANGTIVIPSNVHRDIEAAGIGAGLRTKVNATVGTSTDIVNFDEEVQKAQIAIDHGADCLMELSIGGDMNVIRRRVLDMSPIPVGSVPVYQAAIESTCSMLLKNRQKTESTSWLSTQASTLKPLQDLKGREE